MKFNSLLTIALCTTVPMLSYAKKPKTPEATPNQEQMVVHTEEAEPTITEDCLVNVSLFNESVKNKQYEDAYEPWWYVYQNCPNANKAVYTQGSKIIDWKYKNATTPEEKQRLRQLILEMHDKRVKYFGDDPKYPTAYILGQKALDYCDYFEDDALKLPALEWLRQSVDGMGQKSQDAVLAKLVEVSYNVYKSNPDQYGEQFIMDYEKAAGYLSAQAADPANKRAAIAARQKEYADGLFAASGAADCDKMDEIYSKVVTANADNLDMLTKIATLYKRVHCTESDVYFAACEGAHKLQPTEESAAGCARMFAKKGDYRSAINYYEEAISRAQSLDENDEDIPDYYLNIASIYYNNLKNYPQARTYARRSLEVKPDQGRCYILIGLCYAASQPYSTSDYQPARAAILNKTVFWVAVDKFQQAKRIDPTCTSDADKLIATYSKYFPTKEEMFDLPNDFGGATFYVGGWIGESTTCRAH